MNRPTNAQLRTAGTVLQALLPFVPGGAVVSAATALVNGGMKLLDVRQAFIENGATPEQMAHFDAENERSVIDVIHDRGDEI